VRPAFDAFFHKRPDRADLGAEAAESAVGVFHVVEEVRCEYGLEAALRKVDSVETGDFVACADALRTENALVHVPYVVLVGVLELLDVRARQLLGLYFMRSRELAELAFEDVGAAALHAALRVAEGLFFGQPFTVLLEGGGQPCFS